ncbi:DUF421 domain-containing protein [Muricoccus radiodurans]|uniref:DUF421 domain-containing protein n=1 Tax=Muricoccus radiodurans TaxID=2231721 RepID=UPI003CF44FF8
MDTVLRAVAVYVALLLLFRISGRRSLAQVTTFDFVLLLIVGEATQQALLGEDFSVTNAIIVIVTLMGLDVALSLYKRGNPRAERVLEGLPTILVADGVPLRDRLAKSRVSEADILQSARATQGILRMDEIRLAVLEVSGGISIIPRDRTPA